jgi:hypothetical protein
MSTDALRLAIKLAVDAGEYGRAAVRLDVALQNDSSQNVTEKHVGCRRREGGVAAESAPPGAPSTSTEAVRLAIKLAIDAGEYGRASALLGVLRAGRSRQP